MEIIGLVNAVLKAPPEMMGLVALMVTGYAYTNIRSDWKLGKVVEILTTVKPNPKTKVWDIAPFYDRGVLSKKFGE